MVSAVSRPTSAHPPRVARKKSSLLSLHAEPPTPPTSAADRAASVQSPSYFQRYPRAAPSSHSPSSKPPISLSSDHGATPRAGPRPSHTDANTLEFPSRLPTTTNARSPEPLRLRSSTLGDADYRHPYSPPALRFSGSSSHTFTEPPGTPLDSFPPHTTFDTFPVVVAAPVSGVETMDALVDGMNASLDDDLFTSPILARLSARRDKPPDHLLYHPPLPTPPPGVKLGRPVARRPSVPLTDSDTEEDHAPTSPVERRRPRRLSHKTRSSSQPELSKHVVFPLEEAPSEGTVTHTAAEKLEQPISKALVPSISEIIRTHGPPVSSAASCASGWSRPHAGFKPSWPPSSVYHSAGPLDFNATVDCSASEDEEPLASRSSIDSITEEVQATLRSLPVDRQRGVSRVADIAFGPLSPTSDPGLTSVLQTPSRDRLNPEEAVLQTPLSGPPSPSQAIASYLRSVRLTTLLKLVRSPHASHDHPLGVSLCDLGSPTGHPLVVFLGLGCVRHVMGLYDEMAECLGLRIIAIDRWGLGRTGQPHSKSARGIQEWASVVEEVLDQLHIYQCSVMAHSAGAPYALAFANRVPERIRGEVCLLAPWVGGSENVGYKWLKYVPNGILKTAQAADWKYQAWQLGKPPAINYEGIGYISTPRRDLSPTSSLPPKYPKLRKLHEPEEKGIRPSLDSASFSEYDDLKDFEGRFQSRSTLNVADPNLARAPAIVNRKPSRPFLGRLKGGPSSQPQTPVSEDPPISSKKLRNLRSLSSLRQKSVKSAPNTISKATTEKFSPQLPSPTNFGVGLGLDDASFVSPTTPTTATKLSRAGSFANTNDRLKKTEWTRRHGGRRSISLTSSLASSSGIVNSSGFHSSGFTRSLPSSSASPNSPTTLGPVPSFQAGLGNALLAASHAEASKGTHADLLQILNHDRKPWGFSYDRYPLHVRIWHGDKDERIPESAIRWMRRTMGEGRCDVKMIAGADHALLYKSSIVVEVMETLREYWKDEI